MKKIVSIFVILLSLSACKKSCYDDKLSEGSKFLEITKTSKGICIKNKYIYPVKITRVESVLIASSSPDFKVLSGISKTFRWEDFTFYQGHTPADVKIVSVFFERDLCDYKDRKTPLNGYHADLVSVQF